MEQTQRLRREPIQIVVKQYRKQRRLSLRKFADELTGGLDSHGIEISHQTIKNWEDGETKPDFSFVLSLALTTHDWRGDFAFDLLSVMKPEIYEPMTSIGEKALLIVIEEQANSQANTQANTEVVN